MKALLTTDSGIAIALDKDEPLVSHRDISIALGIEPRSMMQLIKDYLCDFQELGVVRFQNAKPPKGTDGGRTERIAYLNEDQSFLALTYSRNTPKAREAKVRLVKAFKAAREQLAQRTTQYLPLHHSAHSKAHLIALKARQDGSKAGETLFHSNMERLINKVFGIEVNSRHTLSAQQCATVCMAYAIYDECKWLRLG